MPIRELLTGLALLATPAPANPPQRDVMEAWEGRCSESSYIANGTARAPYPCNAMIYIEMAAEPGHILLIFAIKNGGETGMIGLGGMIDRTGVLKVERVQFTPGVSAPVDPASCRITRDGEALKRVQCSARASDNSGREVSLDFAVSGKVILSS